MLAVSRSPHDVPLWGRRIAPVTRDGPALILLPFRNQNPFGLS